MNAAPAGSPGVDYAWARPSPSSLHQWGYRFACRYLSNDPGKNLSAAEAKALIGAGVDVVLNWESTATSALGGAPQGSKDGQAAEQQAASVGAPVRAAVYFSVDFDAQPNQFATIAGYLDAARKQLGGRRIGVYGGKTLIDAMVGTHADLGWQTLAWSGGQLSAKAAIYQDRVNITLPDGSSADHNRILRAEYGGWLAPAPAPQPTPGGDDKVLKLVKSDKPGATAEFITDFEHKWNASQQAINTGHALGFLPDTTVHVIPDAVLNLIPNA